MSKNQPHYENVFHSQAPALWLNQCGRKGQKFSFETEIDTRHCIEYRYLVHNPDSLRIYRVNSFSTKILGGNPAAVCVLEREISERAMQALAAEMNLSETAFVTRRDPGFAIRWFTPVVEVDLCGHGTLASAHILWETGVAERDKEIQFASKSGALICRKTGSWIEMDFPVRPVSPVTAPPELEKALGVRPRQVSRDETNFLVELSSEEELRALRPDFALLRSVPSKGVIATALSSDPRYDFVSRYFAPNEGIDDDPVCGSAHCSLAPYWRDRLQKDPCLAYQASQRGGEIRTEIRGERVMLSGQAITLFVAEMDFKAFL